ncbi:MAG TPA: ABC transporter substrate-binding protein [Trueperaceae bacterium]|nr:ABC transporter substrate-binding protein [Trueperaceae bacterium]
MRLLRLLTTCALALALSAAVAQGAPPQSTFTLGMSAETATFYPPGTGGLFERNSFLQIFDALMHREADGTIVPRIATSWEAVDATTWRFVIRQGVTFTNGEALDAETVKASLDIYRAPDSVVASRYRNISEIVVVDDYTVDVLTSVPDPFLPNALTDNAFILPIDYLTQVGKEQFASQPIGTGPYVLSEWVRGDRIVFAANSAYWGGDVPIARVIWRTIPEPSSRVAALQNGEVDLIWEIPSIQVPLLERTPGVEVQAGPSPRAVYIGLWPDSPVAGGEPLRDVRVRQALNYAVNRQAIVQALQRGYGTLISQPIPQANYLGYDASIEPYPYDPAKARELLAEAGYPDGFNIELLTTARYLTAEESQAVAADLAAVGVKVKLVEVEYGQFVTRLTQEKSQSPMYSLSIQGTQGVDAYEIYSVAVASTGTFNWNHYTNPAVDALVAQMGSEFDNAARAELAHQVAHLTHDDPPWIYLWNNSSIYGVKDIWDWTRRSDDLLSVYDDVRW